MWWRKKKKYQPTGRVGYYRKCDYPWYYRIIVEKIQEINESCKVRILEVDINRGCTKNREQCLNNAMIGDWVRTEGIHWETDEQYSTRICDTEQRFTTPFQLVNDEVDYTQFTTNPFRHNFINNQ
jgi:hypothetical protein